MYCSGVGKAIMATLPEKEVKQIWNESIIEKKTDKKQFEKIPWEDVVYQVETAKSAQK